MGRSKSGQEDRYSSNKKRTKPNHYVMVVAIANSFESIKPTVSETTPVIIVIISSPSPHVNAQQTRPLIFIKKK
jgi:hypothetical protein